MNKIEIMLKATTMNEQSLIKSCENYPTPKNQIELNELDYTIGLIKGMSIKLPHGKAWAGARRLRTGLIDILEDKREEYLTNQMKGE